jgi:hypothetical protein
MSNLVLRRRRRRRARRNPIPSDEVINVGSMLAGVFLFATGAHRLAGAVGTGNGLWQLHKGHKISGYANVLVGTSFLLWPNWPASLGKTAAETES